MTQEAQDALISCLVSRSFHHDFLGDKQRSMFQYAVKLTRTPGDMNAGDVEDLKSHGFDDRGIHDICAIAAYFNFVNRTADGLGVELEDRFNE